MRKAPMRSRPPGCSPPAASCRRPRATLAGDLYAHESEWRTVIAGCAPRALGRCRSPPDRCGVLAGEARARGRQSGTEVVPGDRRDRIRDGSHSAGEADRGNTPAERFATELCPSSALPDCRLRAWTRACSRSAAHARVRRVGLSGPAIAGSLLAGRAASRRRSRRLDGKYFGTIWSVSRQGARSARNTPARPVERASAGGRTHSPTSVTDRCRRVRFLLAIVHQWVGALLVVAPGAVGGSCALAADRMVDARVVAHGSWARCSDDRRRTFRPFPGVRAVRS